MKKWIVAAAAMLVAASCGGDPKNHDAAEPAAEAAPVAEVTVIGVDELAERFVKLALELGQYDAAYVDAYSGPPDWADGAKAHKRSLADLEIEARDILEALDVLGRGEASPRERGLKGLATAALMRIRMAEGQKFSFDEEARALYGVAPPPYDLTEFDAALADVDKLLPGDGDLATRVEAFRSGLAIPADKLAAVFDAAINECRRRTRLHYDLPEGESFIVRYVTDKPWTGYNWYQGDYHSIIEVNTDLPIIIDRAVDLGCHEGYPGHHVWNVVVERDLRRKNNWIEYSIYPLFSPQSFLGEGSANYGIELAFPGDERLTFEQSALFPLAGLDPAKAAKLDQLNLARRKLAHARNFIARDYLDGKIDRDAALALTLKYGLESRERSEKSLDFIDTYRSYVINYNLGRDRVAAFIAEETASGVDPWVAFEGLLKSPDAAGDLSD
jgi:hypothetical protein